MATDTAKTIEETKGRLVEAALQVARLRLAGHHLEGGKMVAAPPKQLDTLISHFEEMIRKEAKFILLLQWEK
jgi:hypothetical protein